jgi:hypothetical protein
LRQTDASLNLTDTASGIPKQREFDMTSFVKAAGLAGILVAVVATATPDLKADRPSNTVREGQGVTTELGANASAITYWMSRSEGCTW